MSLRYVLIISKCLSELNIRNLNLLTGLNNRVSKIIEQDNVKRIKDRDDDNFIDSNSVAQILMNFVKLEFIDYESYNRLEDLFFAKCSSNPELLNKETIFTIFYAHCSFYKKLFTSFSNNIKGQTKNDLENVTNKEAELKKVQHQKFNKGLW